MEQGRLAQLLSVAEDAARAGAAVVRGARASRTESKGTPGDYVTDVDRASEAAIVEVLRAEAGDIPSSPKSRAAGGPSGSGRSIPWTARPTSCTGSRWSAFRSA